MHAAAPVLPWNRGQWGVRGRAGPHHRLWETPKAMGWKRIHASRQIDAAHVAMNLSPTGDIPENEWQVRPMVGLPPEMQREVWNEAVQASPDESLSGFPGSRAESCSAIRSRWQWDIPVGRCHQGCLPGF